MNIKARELPHTIGGYMKRIIKIGIDVHTTSHTLCIYEPSLTDESKVLFRTQIIPKAKNILKAIKNFKEHNPNDEFDITCGYEAGYLGFSLYRELKELDPKLKCVILAPTKMKTEKGGDRQKNDHRDAKDIAECMSSTDCKYVHVPTEEDEAIKEYLRMREDIKANFKKIKQQILALLARHGHLYDTKCYWTNKFFSWYKSLVFDDELLKETLDEYFIEYYHLEDRLEKLDRRIEELADKEEYKEDVAKLKCFIGIKTNTALSLIVETSDFKRFQDGSLYSAYLGLIPGERSSSDKVKGLSLTKQGNRHLRRLLIEAAQSYTRGIIGYKSKDLKERQAKCSSEVIAYADKANTRLRKKYYHMILRGKNHNIAKAAIARELASFIWGMMTDNIAL